MIQLPHFLQKFFTKKTPSPQEKNNGLHTGDRVMVHNPISITDTWGDRPDRMFRHPKITFVVEKTGRKNKLTIREKGKRRVTYTQDIIICEPETGEKFRVSSEHVKRAGWVKCSNGK